MALLRRSLLILALILALITLACTQQQVRADDDSSSTGPEEDSSTADDSTAAVDDSSTAIADESSTSDAAIVISSSSSASEHSSTLDLSSTVFLTSAAANGTNSTNSSSTGPYVDPRNIVFSYYVCGTQKINASIGYYWDTLPWEDPTAIDYLDITADGEDRNISTARGYPQCWGRSTQTNCFDHWVDNTDPRYSTRRFAGPTVNGLSFVKGDVSPPISVISGGGERLFRMDFYPDVDQFALLQIQSSFNGTGPARNSWAHLGTVFQVEINGFTTEYRHRYGTYQTSETVCDEVDGKQANCRLKAGNTCLVVPFWTVLISMTKGSIDKIEFDDDSSTCGKDYIVDGNCAVPIDTCTQFESFGVAASNATAVVDCEFKLYVAWSGTDSDGTYLSSSGRRLSQFRKWSLRSIYNQASSLSLADLPVAPPAADAKI